MKYFKDIVCIDSMCKSLALDLNRPPFFDNIGSNTVSMTMATLTSTTTATTTTTTTTRTTSTTTTTTTTTTLTSGKRIKLSRNCSLSEFSVKFSSGLNINLVTNGDGESGLCESGNDTNSPSGWTFSGPITQLCYNNTKSFSDFVDQTLSTPGPT